MSHYDPNWTIASLGAAYRARDTSPVEVTTAVLDRITATEPQLHAYVTIDTNGAMAAAAAAERDFAQGVDHGPLQGIPVGVKDIFDWQSVATRCGSPLFEHREPAEADSTAVARLRAGGAVLLGKTVTQEWAAGVVSHPARNPWDPNRIPGGSSGGSAAAVAIGSAIGALGSDTGGSIRIPASVTGTVGLKPTYGRVSKAGVFPLAWSLDTVGPITLTVEDAAIFLNVIAGHDPADPTTANRDVTDATAELPADRDGPGSLSGVRIGIPRRFFFERVQPGVVAAVEHAMRQLEELGAELVDVTWAEAAAARALGTVVNRAEGTAVHRARYDENPEGFGPEMVPRMEIGRRISANDYIMALRSRPVIKRSMARLFSEHRLDALLAPSTPATALRADNLMVTWEDGEESVVAAYTRLTTPFNTTGQPVLSLPCGFDESGLPVGLQLAGKPFKEAALCRIGHAYERAAGWWKHHPQLSL